MLFVLAAWQQEAEMLSEENVRISFMITVIIEVNILALQYKKRSFEPAWQNLMFTKNIFESVDTAAAYQNQLPIISLPLSTVSTLR